MVSDNYSKGNDKDWSDKDRFFEQQWEMIKEPAYWNDLWQYQLAKGSRKLSNEKESIQRNIERWKKRAKPFAANVLGKKGNPRVEKIIAWLQSQGVVLENSRILDIGSGPGAFAIPFAKVASEVVALEPVAEMNDALRVEMDNQGIRNITIVQEPWETISIEDNHWESAFNLVFASMVPGINNEDTVDKALRCSRKYCYISSFAGKREYQGIRDVWPLLFDSEYPPFHLDMQPLLNLLYAKGLTFTFRVWEENRDPLIEIDVASEELYKQLQLMADDKITSVIEARELEIKEKILQYVTSRAKDGIYQSHSSTRLGVVLIELYGAGNTQKNS